MKHETDPTCSRAAPGAAAPGTAGSGTAARVPSPTAETFEKNTTVTNCSRHIFYGRIKTHFGYKHTWYLY